jgi:hypothetical protein
MTAGLSFYPKQGAFSKPVRHLPATSCISANADRSDLDRGASKSGPRERVGTSDIVPTREAHCWPPYMDSAIRNAAASRS